MPGCLRRYAVSTLLGCLTLVLGTLAGLGTAQTPAPFAPSFAKAVIFATNSVLIGQGTYILSGDILVNDAPQSPTLAADVALALAPHATTPNSDALVVAERLRVDPGAVILGTAFFTQTEGQGTMAHAVSPVPGGFPVLEASEIPPFPSVRPGTTPVSVGKGALVTLDAGDYGVITVAHGGTLTFTGGLYHIQSLRAADRTQLLFQGPTELRVAGQFLTGRDAIIGPDEAVSAPPTAADLVVLVAGQNGTGAPHPFPDTRPAAVTLGRSTLVAATFWAPNGTVAVQQATVAEGAFVGRDVWIEPDVQITFKSFFQHGPPRVRPATFRVAEKSAPGTVVGTVTFSDSPAGQRYTFALTGGNTRGAFAINTSTGQLTVASSTALDVKTTPSFRLIVQVTNDARTPLSGSAAITVNVTEANVAPVVNAATFSVAENSATGTVVGTVTFSDPDAGQSHTFALTAGNTGGAFALNTSTGQLTVASSAALDFETTPTFPLTVQVTDNGTPPQSGSATITVNVRNVNEAPVVNAATFSVAENSVTGTVVGTVTFSDPDVGQTGTFAITGGNTSGAFALNASTGQLTVASSAALDFETTPTFTLTVQVTDNCCRGRSPLAGSATITVNLTNVNETPTDITLANASVAENQATGTGVGTWSATDPDTGDSHTFTLVAGTGDTDNASFQIVGTQLQTAAIFNFEVKNSFSIRVRATDAGSLFVEKPFTISVTNVNEAPTDITLANASVAENQATGTGVGTWSATDPDTGDSHTFTLVAGTGDTDNASFQIVGTQLQTAAMFNFEVKNSYSIRVRATDAGSLFVEKPFTISVTNVNEAPTDIALANASVAENQATGAGVGTWSATDPDAGATHTFTLVAGAGSTDNASFQIVGNALQTAAIFNFEVKNSYSIRVRATDAGSLFVEKPFTISVIDVNEAPVAVNKNYSAQANMNIAMAAGSGLLVGATDQDAGSVLTVGAVSATTPAGGNVTVTAATGAFDFDPPPGATGNVTFTYTVCDNGVPSGPSLCSAAATVTINVASPVIWFVDNVGGSDSNNGTLAHPFKTLTAVNSVDASGHRIFLYTGTYSAGITLNSNEWLIGQGVTGSSFDSYFSLTVPAGTIVRPTINGTNPNVNTAIGFTTQDKIDGLDMDGANANLSGSSATSFTVNIGRFRRTGTSAAKAINLGGSGNTGNFDFKSITVTGVSGTGNTGVSVSNLTGHFIVAGTDTGVSPNGGTISGYGANGMEFKTVANGASTAVSLTKMTLTGNGISQTVPGTDTHCGGALTTGDNLQCVANLYLQAVNKITLDTMTISNSGQAGINGNDVTDFVLTNSTVSGNGNATGENGINFQNLRGTSKVEDTNITNSGSCQFCNTTLTGTLTLDVKRTNLATMTIGNSAHWPSTGASGHAIESSAYTSATMTLRVDGVTLQNMVGQGVLSNVQGSSTLTGYVKNSTFSYDGAGVNIQTNNTANVNTFDTMNNSFVGMSLSAINYGMAAGSTGTLRGTISDNHIGTSGVAGSACDLVASPAQNNCAGITMSKFDAGALQVLAKSNTMYNVGQNGITVTSDLGGTVDVKIQLNTIREPYNSITPVHATGNAIQVNLGTGNGTGQTACVDIVSNTIDGAENPSIGGPFGWDPNNPGRGMYIRSRNSVVTKLPNYSGGDNATLVRNFLAGQNTITNQSFTTAGVDTATGTFANGTGNCNTP